MKNITGFLSKAIAIAIAGFACSHHAHAALDVVAAGYGAQTVYTHSTTDSIISYDWDASHGLHYMTSAGYPDVQVWRTTGGPATSVYSAPSNFAGASVVSIGGTIYFNDSNFSNTQFIRGYNATAASPVVSVLSTTANSNLSGHNGGLYITGANGFGPNHIFYSDLAANGTLVNNPVKDLGATSSGGSGPLAFNLAGDLYYAPGFGDMSVYKFSSAEVAAAVANPLANPLTGAGNLWLDYSALFPAYSGATSMALDAAGNLLMTLTNFGDPSLLVEFGATPAGVYNGTNFTILTDTDRLGELRNLDGDLFVSSGNQIVQIMPVPEPGTAGFVALLGVLSMVVRRRRRNAG